MIAKKKNEVELAGYLWFVLFFPMHAFLWVLPILGVVEWLLSEVIAIAIIALWTSPHWIKSIENNKNQKYKENKLLKISTGALSIAGKQSGELSINE